MQISFALNRQLRGDIRHPQNNDTTLTLSSEGQQALGVIRASESEPVPKAAVLWSFRDPFSGVHTLLLAKLLPHQTLLALHSGFLGDVVDPSMRDRIVNHLELFCTHYRSFLNEQPLLDLIPISDVFCKADRSRMAILAQSLRSNALNEVKNRIEAQCFSLLKDHIAVLNSLKKFIDIRYAKEPTANVCPTFEGDQVKECIEFSGLNHGGVQYDHKLSALLPVDRARTEQAWLEGLSRIFIDSGVAGDFLFEGDLSKCHDLESIQRLKPKSTILEGSFSDLVNSAHCVDELLLGGREAGEQLLQLAGKIKGVDPHIQLYFGHENAFLYKSRSSIEEKLTVYRAFGYDTTYGIHHVEDVYRGTIMVDNIDALKSALIQFQKGAGHLGFQYEMELMAYDLGFFGVNAKLLYQSDSGQRSLGELQFHFTQMISSENSAQSAKDISHEIYEVTRLGAPCDLAARGGAATTLLCLSVMERIV